MSYPGSPMVPQAIGSPYQGITNASNQLANALLYRQFMNQMQPKQQPVIGQQSGKQLSNYPVGSQVSNNSGWLSNLFGLGGGGS